MTPSFTEARARLERKASVYGVFEFVLTQRSDIRAALAEIDRLQRGDFTAEEIHRFCHNLQNVSRDEFAAGCEVYIGKLYDQAVLPHTFVGEDGVCSICDEGVDHNAHVGSPTP